VRAGVDPDPNLQAVVGVQGVRLPVVRTADVPGKADRGRHPRCLAAERELPDAGAVKTKIDLVCFVDPADIADVVGPQTDLNPILAVDRKVMANRRAAARAEREVFALLVVLEQVQRDIVGLDDGATGGWPADDEPADLPRRRHVPLEQGRRE